jgi:hypothetical protein
MELLGLDSCCTAAAQDQALEEEARASSRRAASTIKDGCHGRASPAPWQLDLDLEGALGGAAGSHGRQRRARDLEDLGWCLGEAGEAASLAANGGGDFWRLAGERWSGRGEGVVVTGRGLPLWSWMRGDIFGRLGSLFSGRARPSSRAKLDFHFAARQGGAPFFVSPGQGGGT